MLCLQCFQNTFTTNNKWEFVIGGQKNNFNNRYKLKQKTICWKVFEKSYLKD